LEFEVSAHARGFPRGGRGGWLDPCRDALQIAASPHGHGALETRAFAVGDPSPSGAPPGIENLIGPPLDGGGREYRIEGDEEEEEEEEEEEDDDEVPPHGRLSWRPRGGRANKRQPLSRQTREGTLA